MKHRAEVAVGLSIVLGLAIIFFGTIYLKGSALGREEIVLRAHFLEVGNLTKGNSVKVRGVPIGRVDEITLEPAGHGVIVAMRIDGEVDLPEDPIVLLSPESMFGDWQAEIHPRTSFPRYAYSEPDTGDPNILPGYTLPDISKLTAVADQIAQNLATLTDRVEIAFTEETAHNIREAIENIQQVSEQLTGLVSSQQKTMEEVAANLETTTRTLGQAAETVRRVFAQAEAATAKGELSVIVGNLQRATQQADSLTAALLAASHDFRRVAATADSTFHSLEEISELIQHGEGTLGRLLRDTVFYTDVVRTNALLQALLEDFQKNPRKYINLKIF